jgi:transcriptional regulator with XRE-family HTH domain
MARSVSNALTIRRKIIGVLLQGARLRAGKSKKECAEALGVSVATLNSFEAGRRDVTLPQLEVLAYFLKVPASSFFKDQDQSKLVSEEPELPIEQVMALRHRIVGVLLRKARGEASKSKKEVAKAAGISARKLTAYESGERPIPLTELQAIADFLRLPMAYFLDEGVGRIGAREQLHNQFERFSELPEDVRDFVSHYTNLPYIRVAIRLSSMETDRIRGIAEGLLDITY